ncbi:MAG TPA: 2'-5' RNA ligase family protein [Gaiellaceae bacterium]|nr:2'-5' RNA ligase family protein [Gaiellaceae bacterium]
MTSRATVEGGERLRLFCALTLPEPVLDGFVSWQRRELPLDVRVVPRENLHVTVAFLGPRPAADVPRVAAELEAAAAAGGPIRFAVDRYRETRSVGMLALDDADGHAGRFALDVFARLERLGVYEPERRPWLPHVTALRFRLPPRLQPSLPDLGEFSPSGAAVYLSELRPGGAQYVVLESFGLGG